MNISMKTKQKIWFLSGLPIGILLILWLWSNTLWIALVAGLLGSLHSIYTLLKPQIVPHVGLFSLNVIPDKYFLSMQRFTTSIILVISIFALINYKVTSTREIGIALLLISAVLIFNSIILMPRFFKIESLWKRVQVAIGMTGAAIFVVAGIRMMIDVRSFEFSQFHLWTFLAGYLIAIFINFRYTYRHFE